MSTKTKVNNFVSKAIDDDEVTCDLTDVKFPRMLPLQSLSDECGISYKALWRMCKENRIVHIKSGNKFLVNVDKFIEFLNSGEQETD